MARSRQQTRVSNQVVVDGDQIFLYDVIDSWGDIWGISATEFVDALSKMDADPIHLRVNSPGGMVFEGVAIKNAIAEHKSTVIAHVDSLAASMASGIIMEADEIIMARGAFIMIHDPWSVSVGDAGELRREADFLDQIGDSLAENYAQRSGLSVKDVRDLMREETWLGHNEAVEMGFADSVQGDGTASNEFDLSVFQNVPNALQGGMPRKPSDRSVEKALRDAGMTRKEARDFVHAAKSQREAGGDPGDEAGRFLSDWKSEIRQSM